MLFAVLYTSGDYCKVRGILDQGAMNNYCTSDLINCLGIKKEKTNLTVCGIGDTFITIKHVARLTISNFEGNYKKELDFLVVPKIADLMPSKELKINSPELNNVKLADENFNKPGWVDVLLSAEIFYELLLPGQIYPENSDLILQNTIFGYVVSGSVPIINTGHLHCGFIEDNMALTKSIEKFWELEHVGMETPKNIECERIKSKENKLCEEHYLNTHFRNSEGGYVVQMPFKEEPSVLGNSKNIAIQRLTSLWNRMSRDPEYLSLYKNFIH